MLVDTGGIEPKTNDIILAQMRRQAQLAIDKADVIIFVTDIRTGLTASDYDVATMLQKSGKPIVLCVNKCDNIGELPMEFYEFYNLGLGEPFPVSSVHGHGTGDMLDEVLKHLPTEDANDYSEEYIKVAVIGKPNAGKSSLVNRLAGEERTIVSDIAGTTRDATDTVIENSHGKYVFIDTAGIRKKSKVNEKIEHYSVLRAYMAVDRADVCIIMIDAETGFTEQDSKVAGYAHQQGKASIVAINKWDLIEKDTNTMNEFLERLKNDFSFMSYVPFIFISAKTGQRVEKLYDMINHVHEQHSTRITTGTLNDVLAMATTRVQPPSDKGKRLKIYYMTQASTNPPTFVVFCNKIDLFHFSYRRYIENQVRIAFKLDNTPLKFIVRERGNGKDVK
jgi:GTP-binding protein